MEMNEAAMQTVSSEEQGLTKSQHPESTNNIETQEWAKKVFSRYVGNERVSEIYDDDEQFANALHDLIGPDFEYPDFAHLTVAEVLKKAWRQ